MIERYEHNMDEKIEEMVERVLLTDEIIVVTQDGHRILKARDEDLKPGY